MLGTTKHWNNYQGMETVSSRTYVWPTEKFYHQIDPMAMVLLFNGFFIIQDLYSHSYNPFKGSLQGAASEYMIR